MVGVVAARAAPAAAGAAPRPWVAVAVVVAALPIVAIVALLALGGSFELFRYSRLLLLAAVGSGTAYVGIIRLSHMRRREPVSTVPTHTGLVGLALSDELLVVRYPDRAVGFPWRDVVGARMAAGADGVGAGDHTQIVQQLSLEVRTPTGTETVVLHEMLEASDAALSDRARDVLGTFIAAADWITERAKTR